MKETNWRLRCFLPHHSLLGSNMLVFENSTKKPKWISKSDEHNGNANRNLQIPSVSGEQGLTANAQYQEKLERIREMRMQLDN